MYSNVCNVYYFCHTFVIFLLLMLIIKIKTQCDQTTILIIRYNQITRGNFKAFRCYYNAKSQIEIRVTCKSCTRGSAMMRTVIKKKGVCDVNLLTSRDKRTHISLSLIGRSTQRVDGGATLSSLGERTLVFEKDRAVILRDV